MSGEACPNSLQGSTAVIPCAHAAGHPPLRDGADRYWAHGTGSLHWDRLRDLDAPVTAASGADRACPLCAGVDPRHISPIIQAHHAAHANVREDRRRQAGADHAAFERARADLADQPTLRDQRFREALKSALVPLVTVPDCWRSPGEIADALLPLIEADRERAKAEAAAEAWLRARAATLRANPAPPP